MDDRAAYVHDNPLFSPNFRVTSEAKKKTPKNTPNNTPKNNPKKTPKNLEKNASSIKVEMGFSSNSSQSAGMTRDSNSGGGRHSRRHSIIEDDKEWDGLEELRMKVRKFMEEQGGSGNNETGNAMSYSPSPVIIQAGGVASYHPLYFPSDPRPRLFKYEETSPESSTHTRTPADIQRSETISKAETEAEGDVKKEADQGRKEEEFEALEESQSHQLAQDPHSLGDPRSEITIGDAEQPQASAEPDDSHSHSIDRSTVGFKISSYVVRIPKKMSPLLMLLILATTAFGIGLLNDNYLGTGVVQYQSNHTRPMPLTERKSLPQKVKWFFFLSWEPVHFEYMGRVKTSSCAFVGRLVDFLSHCSCSSFSYLKSYKGSMIGKDWAKFGRRLMATISSFYQDFLEFLPRYTVKRLVRIMFGGGEIQEFCKCQPINISCLVDSRLSKNTTVDIEQGSKDETNQRLVDNSFTSPIEEATSFTIDVNDTDLEYNDQYFEQEPVFGKENESQEESVYGEEDELQCSFPEVSEAERVHSNPSGKGAFSTTSWGSINVKSGMAWKIVALVAISLLLIAGANHYLEQRKAQTKKVKKPRQRREQIEQTATPPMLGSFLQYPGQRTSTCVRRSLRIRNKSVSPTLASPSSEHSFS